MTAEERARLREIYESATPGEWRACRLGVLDEHDEIIAAVAAVESIYSSEQCAANAQLLAAAKRIGPLLDDLDAVDATVATLRAALRRAWGTVYGAAYAEGLNDDHIDVLARKGK